MTSKFLKEELEDNQISARLKNKLSQMANSYVCKYTLQYLQYLKKNKILTELISDKRKI